MVRFISISLTVAFACLLVLTGQSEAQKKEKSPLEGKKGKVVGTLTAKKKGFIEVRADGEEKPRQYHLHFGGTKELLKTIAKTPVGSRVEVDWLYVERFRVIAMNVLEKD